MPLLSRLAALSPDQVQALAQIATNKKKRQPEVSGLARLPALRLHENISVSMDFVPAPELSRQEKRLAIPFFQHFVNIASRQEQGFSIVPYSHHHLQLAQFEAETLNSIFSYLHDNRAFASLALQEGQRLFGPKIPMIAGSSHPVPSLQAILKYSIPMKEASVQAAQANNRLMEELFRRERLSHALSWPLNSTGEYIIRHLDPRLSDKAPVSAPLKRSRLDNMVWYVLGKAFSSPSVQSSALIDWALHQKSLVATMSLDGVTMLSQAERQRLNDTIGLLAKDYDLALQQVLPSGLGLDVEHYLSDGTMQPDYNAEAGSLMALLATRYPLAAPLERLGRAAFLLQQAINSGILPAKFNHASAFFTSCGLVLDKKGGISLQTTLMPASFAPRP